MRAVVVTEPGKVAIAELGRPTARPYQRFHVAKTGGGESFHGADDTFRIGAVHAIKLALSGRPINQKPLHRPSRCFISS